ncbi:MAG: hypothetical protein QG635_916, partial [Bacteroidota bacterium]|nr:hypothetical protein [Bacteroidota bacterium]
ILVSIGVTLFQKPDLRGEIEVYIAPHTTTAEIIGLYNERGLLKPAWFFEIIAKIYSVGSGKKIVSGYYLVTGQMTGYNIVESLFSDSYIHTIKVTFPEGIGYRQFAEILGKRLGIDEEEFLRLAESDSVLSRFGINGRNVEGYLLPETYQFFPNHNVRKILFRLLGAFERTWESKFAERAKELGLDRNYVLTMASIIEAETPIAKERPVVAGVYYNRLRLGMKLEADPTVQYAIGAKRKIYYKDLRVNSRYNTYMYDGLPPGPINCPGASAIEAALSPSKNDYLYFVAKGDGSGAHVFSSNYGAHLKNVAAYRRNRK